MATWKKIKGYMDRYMVSSDGRIARIMKCREYPNGYKYVSLTREKFVSDNLLVHDLVARSFVGPRPDGHHINHVDGVKTHNHFSNLQYVTRSQNIRHAIDIGLIKVGEDHYAAKLSAFNAMSIRFAQGIGSSAQVAKIFGVSPSTVTAIWRGEIWKSLNNETFEIAKSMGLI